MKTEKNKIEFDEVMVRFWDLSESEIYVKLIEGVEDKLRPTFPKTEEAFRKSVKDTKSGNGIIYYAIVIKKRIDDVIVNIIVGGISYEVKEKNIIELGYFWIAESYRGNGIGQKAVLKLQEILIEKYTYYKIALQTISSNKNVIEMVENMGFELNARMKVDTFDYTKKIVTLLYYEKDLNTSTVVKIIA